MATNRAEYMKNYMRNYRKKDKTQKAGKTKKIEIDFTKNSFNKENFEKAYWDKLADESQKNIYFCIIDTAVLIERAKAEIEKYGAYFAGSTGGRKVNPAQKEFRESTKLFCTLLTQLDLSISGDSIQDASNWLDEDEV